MTNEEIINKVNILCKSKNCTDITYLTKFGSLLYGTATQSSDLDVKGLFWPNVLDLLFQKKCNSITYSSGKNNEKNSSDDVDIQLWSVHYWLELLSKGDTNSIDLLFSMYTDQSIRISSIDEVKSLLGRFYYNPIELVDMHNNVAYISYAYCQCKKYGIKGTKLDILQKLKNFFTSKLLQETENNRISIYFDELINLYGDGSFVFRKPTRENEDCVWLLGKGFTASTRLYEAVNRLTSDFDKVGNRTLLAAKNEGIDWKAVSHALRCLYQTIEIADTGFLKYPLKCADHLLEVKLGKKDWKNEVEPEILELLDIAKDKVSKLEENKRLQKNHEEIILNHYMYERGEI